MEKCPGMWAGSLETLEVSYRLMLEVYLSVIDRESFEATEEYSRVLAGTYGKSKFPIYTYCSDFDSLVVLLKTIRTNLGI